MSSIAPMLVIGVDGGGTKTVTWLANKDYESPRDSAPKVLGTGTAGPSNPMSVGFQIATENLANAIRAAFDSANLEPTIADNACFCLAGVGTSPEQNRIEQWARQAGIARRSQVVHDGEALLAAAKLREGIALISGTGSFAWGRTIDGQTARSGGWGHLIDDGGSGYWIGVECLKAVVLAADGRGAETALTEAVMTRFRLRRLDDLKRTIYSDVSPKQKIATLATDVFQLSESCPIAAGIITAAAQQLAALIHSVKNQLKSQTSGGFPSQAFSSPHLALGGGVLSAQPRFTDHVISQLKMLGDIPASVTVISEPVQGALLLAARNALKRN